MKKYGIALCMLMWSVVLSAQMMSEKLHVFYESLLELDSDERNKKLTTAIQKNPTEPWYYLMRAEFSSMMGEQGLAENDYKKAIEIAPKSAAANGMYARYLRYAQSEDANALNKALGLINTAISLDPSEHYYKVDKGTIFLLLKNYKQAEELADEVMRISEDFFLEGVELKINVLDGSGQKERLNQFVVKTPEVMELFIVDETTVLLIGEIYERNKMHDNACGIYIAYAEFLLEMDEALSSVMEQKLMRCE